MWARWGGIFDGWRAVKIYRVIPRGRGLLSNQNHGSDLVIPRGRDILFSTNRAPAKTLQNLTSNASKTSKNL